MSELFVTTMTKADIEGLFIDCMKAVIKNHLPNPKPLPAPPKKEANFVTKKQAAQQLNCSTSTIDNYARAGRLTRHYIGRTVRFKLEEVLALAKPIDN